MVAAPRLCLSPALPGAQALELAMRFQEGDYRANIYSCVFKGEEPQVWFYHFELKGRAGLQLVTRGPDGRSTLSGGDDWQLTVYDSAMKAPAAFGNGIMYQIFPDRFYCGGKNKENVPADRILRSDWGGQPHWRPNEEGKVLNNDYFGGDLNGIEEKLPYLASLGVTCLYLNPIFEAHSNHRYNTADYKRIDPLLGTEEDFRSLCGAARKLGISVILDGVFSHTGSDSVYFNKEGRYHNGCGGAWRDRGSPYFPWFRFSNWPAKYECWWDFPTLPNVDELNPGYSEFICGEEGVLRHWLGQGAMGFRLDVADELPDEFLDALHGSVKGHDPDAAVIGEVWEDASNKISYGVRRRYLLGGQMDSVMNYPFKEALLRYMRYGGGESLYHIISEILENYPMPVISSLMNSLSTHDTPRAITALGGDPAEGRDRSWQSSRDRLPEEQYWQGRHLFALCSILQFGLPGVPCVYYGDEAGMCGYKDPFNRGCYPWEKEDGGLVSFIGTLGKIRTDYPIFLKAEFLPLTFSDDVVSFIRSDGETFVLFAVNRGRDEKALLLPEGFSADAKPLALYGGYSGGGLSGLSGVVLLRGDYEDTAAADDSVISKTDSL
jgi:glycosidase